MTDEIVKHHTFLAQVSDMGRNYDHKYTLAGFVADVHGVQQWFALDAVEVWVGPGFPVAPGSP